MPETIIVSRESTVITEKEISTLIEDYLKFKLDFESDQLIIESRSSINEIKIAAGDYELKIAENQNLSLPNTNLKLEVWQDRERLRSLFYPVKINLQLEVLTANKNLRGNSKIRKEDFKITEKSISGDPKKIVRDWSKIDLNNVQLSRSLKKGDLLKFSYLKIPYAVKWGQKLHLKVKVNNIKVSTFVEAKERGKIGEIITVENLNSGYQFQVLIVSPTEVKMFSD
jgi:flagella basal body P-ring formation protein FlgA